MQYMHKHSFFVHNLYTPDKVIGMSVENQQQIFEKFKRVRQDSEDQVLDFNWSTRLLLLQAAKLRLKVNWGRGLHSEYFLKDFPLLLFKLKDNINAVALLFLDRFLSIISK